MKTAIRPSAQGLLAALGLIALLFAGPSRAAEPVVRPAVDGVLAAFQNHPLVGIGDDHGMANEGAFYNQLVKDPRFATEVGNVVVEFGGAAHQDILDRYLAGQDVPYAELRKVWSDVVGWIPTVTPVMYPAFFAQVRAVNSRLPADRRIHVWLGEPAIDWSAVHTRADWQPYLARRDPHAVEVIEQQILARGRKALVIYGGAHFDQAWTPAWLHTPNVKELVEAHHPGAFFTIVPYEGFAQPACSAAFESQFKWPVGSLVSNLKATPVETALLRPDCRIGGPLGQIMASPDNPPITAEEQAHMERSTRVVRAGLASDALLYLGPQTSLMASPTIPDLVMDNAYFQEVSRRNAIITGRPLDLAEWLARISQPPVLYKDR